MRIMTEGLRFPEGPDLRTAFITLSGVGHLAVMEWPEPGLRLNFQP